MSLSSRLLLILSMSLALLWGLTAYWQLHDLRSQMQHALDQRLAASAQMVAGLMNQIPDMTASSEADAALSSLVVPGEAGLACQVSSLQGEVLARTRNASVDVLGNTRPGFSTRIIRDEAWRIYTHEQGNFRIATADRLSERADLLGNIIWSATLPFVIALGGSLLALWAGIRHGLMPLRRLHRNLQERTPDALTPLDTSGLPHELIPFVDTLNHMFVRVDETMVRERRFTSDAAHELRTPLTAIKTHLQVARLGHSEETTQAALANAEEGTERLQHLLEQLLDLARIESGTDFTADVSADTVRTVHTAIQDCNKEARHRIELYLPEAVPKLSMPESLAIIALRNLLDNALCYSQQDSAVKFEICNLPDHIQFRISNVGENISPEMLDRLTNRFWRQGQGPGSGLGLAIVDTIAQRYGGRLHFKTPAAGGLIACLLLPTAPQRGNADAPDG